MKNIYLGLLVLPIAVLSPGESQNIPLNRSGRIDHSSSTSMSYFWTYDANPEESIWLILREHNLVNASNNRCIANVRPTGNWTEMQRCRWSAPTCYFFTRTKSRACADFIAGKIQNCSEISWIFNKDLPGAISVGSSRGTQISFSFYYEYFNCSDESNNGMTTTFDQSVITTTGEFNGDLTSTIDQSTITSMPTDLISFMSSTSDKYNSTTQKDQIGILLRITEFFSGQRILYVLGAALLLLVLLVLLVIIIICKNSKIRKLEGKSKDFKTVSKETEHFQLSSRHGSTSLQSDSAGVSESALESEVYNKLGQQHSARKSNESRRTKIKSKSTSPYDDVAASSNNSISPPNVAMPKEKDPSTLQDDPKEDDYTYSTLNHTQFAEDLPPPPDLPPSLDSSLRDQSKGDEDDGVYDKLNDQRGELSRQTTSNNLHPQDDDVEDSDSSHPTYDNLGAGQGGESNSASNVKQAAMYEDVSSIRIQGDTKNGAYTQLKLNRQKTKEKKVEDLYDTVDRQ